MNRGTGEAPRSLALLGVLLPHQHSLQPTVNLLPVLALKPDVLAGRDKQAHRFQAQLLCFVHADVQSPACLTLQAHLVLESNPPFRLILYWKRVRFDPLGKSPYDYQIGSHPAPAVDSRQSGFKVADVALVAPSFNGRTAASGAAYRGSNP